MPECVKVGECEPHAVRVIGPDVGCSARASDVDADERHLPRGEVGDRRVVVVNADEHRCVEAMLEPDVARLE